MKDLDELKKQYEKLGEEIKRLESRKNKIDDEVEKILEQGHYCLLYYDTAKEKIVYLKTEVYFMDTIGAIKGRFIIDQITATEEEAKHLCKIKNGEIKYMLFVNGINGESECPDNFPNFDDEEQKKYHINYNCTKGTISTDYNYHVKTVRNRELIYKKLTNVELEKLNNDEDILYFFKNR